MEDKRQAQSSVKTAPAITSNERVILVMHQLPVIVLQNPDTKEYSVEWDDENFLSKTHIDKHVRDQKFGRHKSETFKFGSLKPEDDGEDSQLPRLHWFGVVQSPTSIPKHDRPKVQP